MEKLDTGDKSGEAKLAYLDCCHPFPDEWHGTAVGRQAVGRRHVARVEPIAGSKLGLRVTVFGNLEHQQVLLFQKQNKIEPTKI
jgi:hypothetical protein